MVDFGGLDIAPGALLEEKLLNEEFLIEVGGIFRLDFETALVLTADIWKSEAGGLPRFCFLLATARDLVGTQNEDDDEVLLLRVERAAELAQERDLLAVREEALRNALVSGRDPEVSEVMFGLDPFTRERISFTGLECTVLGTFYEDQIDGVAVIQWGSDVDNFYASSTYRVYKPHGDVLSFIASYLRPATNDTTQAQLGSVRYASTQRRAAAVNQDSARVLINVNDFIGQKTGMFGMTRMGKSNTMKTIATQVFIAAAESGRPVGQLVFDPQGEYANENVQDGTALAAIGEDHVRIYRFGADGSMPNVRPLGINFFDDSQIDAVQAMIHEVLSAGAGTAGYMTDFMSVEFGHSQDFRVNAQASRGRLILYGALMKAGLQAPGAGAGFRVRVNMGANEKQKVEAGTGLTIADAGSAWVSIDGGDIRTVVDWIIANADQDLDIGNWTDNTTWNSCVPIYTGASGGRTVRGFRNLHELRVFHNPATTRLVGQEINEDLLDGRIVIVDLHLGAAAVINTLSEQIVLYIIDQQLTSFAGGEEPASIQIILEEAHNLFDRERYASSRDPWVRLAKEASKLRIGLVYATQEVTGVAHQVLANTKNWVVAHLNNSREVNELSRFYDFSAFADSIIKSEDKGYVRLKTESSPYIIPVHVDLFGPEMINQAREAVGLPTAELEV
jgi:hypothetical protein